MWGNLAKQSCLRKFKNLSKSRSCLSAVPVVATPHGLSFSRNAKPIEAQIHVNSGKSAFGSSRVTWFRGKCNGKSLENSIFSGIFRSLGDTKGYASTADALLSTSEEEIDDMQELLEEISKETDDKCSRKRMVPGMGNGKYHLLRRRQIKIETEAWEEAAKEYQELLTDMCEQKLAPNLPYVKSLFLGWFEPLRDAIAAEHVLCEEGKCRAAYAPYFNQLPADMMAVITMHKMIALLMTGGCTGSGRFTESGRVTGRGRVAGSARVIQVASSIGEAIEHEARIHRFLNKVKRKFALNKTSEEGPDHEANEQERLRRKVNSLLKQKKVHEVRKIVRQHDGVRPWGQDAQLKVGSRLVQILMETAYIQPPVDQSDDGPPDIRPAFVHTLKSQDTDKGSRRYGVIECDPLVLKGMERTARHMVIPYMPMLIPPLKWTGYERGAYLFLRSYVMRTHGARQQREAIKRAPKEQLSPVFQALDYLGSTKWRVNKRILGIVDRIWTSGGCIANLVDQQDVPLPEEPDTEDEAERKKWRWKVKNVKKENIERHSRRCDIELKLAVARKMKDEEGFYYPHNLDFRGRAYPMHPYLNHLGSDLCRGILEFAEGRPLGKAGLHWLKIHLANLYGGGVDKLSYEGRVSFTEKHLEDIFDSADRPLDGRRWWLSAEDPLQCLAACMNLSEALRSPYPETVISHMPVHQDGSCNGLQHYAALGRDTLGAAAVNLVAGDKPADVYSGIAARVREIIARDAAADPAINPTAKLARLVINQVDRKLVKQTVMTSVYGVTYIGARDQMKKRLKERNAIEDDNELFGCACYAARLTLTALEEMFESARSIMSWLGDCAKIIAKEENQPVSWTTPLGLPVVQPYRLFGRHLVKTSLQVFTLQRETDQVMVKRQKTAFPPNFVHSLDGSHMMMTALACSQAGLQFAGVHDSYWTHACDVDQMNKILREKFVELYETPILENLLLDFQKSFPNLKFPPLPGRGDFDLSEVRDSVYFFN